eukprot:COSAG03_NODE_691_length_6283_cov_5.537354_3_plen_471_part_01
MPKKSKRARSDAELEANREKQRGRDEARRLASLERKKYLAKELLQGVDCSPASPLNDQEKTKSSRGRKRRAVPGTACRSHAPLPRTPCTPVRASFAGVLTCQEIRMCVQEIAGAAAAHPFPQPFAGRIRPGCAPHIPICARLSLSLSFSLSHVRTFVTGPESAPSMLQQLLDHAAEADALRVDAPPSVHIPQCNSDPKPRGLMDFFGGAAVASAPPSVIPQCNSDPKPRGLMDFFGGAAVVVANTVANTVNDMYTRRFSQEFNSQERESLRATWHNRGPERPFSQPSEPDTRQFDVHWEAHERGLHPSQYSDEEDVAPPSSAQLLLTNADEDPVEEESDHEPYSQELISEAEEAERRGAVALVPKHRRCSAIDCNWAVAALARRGLFHKKTAELFKEVVPGSDVWACAREGHYGSARKKYLRAQVAAPPTSQIPDAPRGASGRPLQPPCTVAAVTLWPDLSKLNAACLCIW